MARYRVGWGEVIWRGIKVRMRLLGFGTALVLVTGKYLPQYISQLGIVLLSIPITPDVILTLFSPCFSVSMSRLDQTSIILTSTPPSPPTRTHTRWRLPVTPSFWNSKRTRRYNSLSSSCTKLNRWRASRLSLRSLMCIICMVIPLCIHKCAYLNRCCLCTCK